MTISIIVPVFNTEMYLRPCIESLLAQTYQQIEILLIDDGSTDSSGSICDEYASADDRIRVIHSNNNGLSEARNKGLDICTGDYIAFVDSDDSIDPDMYEALLNKMIQTGADMVYCGYIIDDGKQTDFTVSEHTKQSCDSYSSDILNGWLTTAVWNRLFNRKLFNDRRFDSELRFAEDIPFSFQIAENANYIASISKCYYHYFTRTDSLVNSTLNSVKIDYLLRALNEVADFVETNQPILISTLLVYLIRNYETILIELSKNPELDLYALEIKEKLNYTLAEADKSKVKMPICIRAAATMINLDSPRYSVANRLLVLFAILNRRKAIGFYKAFFYYLRKHIV